jgi:succinyl-CoA synthetase beta subunit
VHLHEYQAKELLASYGVSVPRGQVATTVDGARETAERLGGDEWVVKAQIHAGGRGKAGGVQRVKGLEGVADAAGRLLGTRLVTHQTGPTGQPVERILVETLTPVARELYLALLIDRPRTRVAVVASAEGGTAIEEVAARDPTAVLRLTLDPVAGLQPFHIRRLGFALGLDEGGRKALGTLVPRLYRAFRERDLGLLELNPLVTTPAGELVALDAKVQVDDNALYRQTQLAALHDPGQEDPRETEARRHDLNYIALDGDIACMVNGAGLAMATMDLIKLHGGRPANFLDVGGGTTAERVAEAFKILLSDPKVRAVLVNIFGGIVRCDLIAEGIVKAVGAVGVNRPLVVRLEGTNAEQGQAILAASGLPLYTASDLSDAARRVVAAAGPSR